MTKIILKYGTSVYTSLPVGEVRQYLQGGNKTGSFRAWLDTTMTTYPIELASQDIAFIDINGNAPDSTIHPSTPVVPESDLIIDGTATPMGSLNADGFSMDLSTYKSLSVQIIGAYVGTVSFQCSNDGTNWVGLAGMSTSSSITGPIASVSNTAGAYYLNISTKYVRVRMTAWTSGSAYVVGVASRSPIGNAAIGGSIVAAGTVAHGTGTSGSPNQIAGESRTTQRSATADAQVSRLINDKLGRTVVKLGHVRELQDTNAMVTLASTTETTIIAAVAATFNDITNIMVTNTSATAVRVDIRDTTGGTVRLSIMAPASTTIYVPISNSVLKQSTVSTNWTAQLGAAVTDVRITTTSERTT